MNCLESSSWASTRLRVRSLVSAWMVSTLCGGPISPAAGESRGRGVSISTRRQGSNRPGPHAQIFFLSAKLLIIFFKSKKSNSGAVSSSLQCKPSQALRRRILGGRRWAGWNSRIYFRSQSARTLGAAKCSVGPRTRTAGLIRVQNLEIKYRKATRPRQPQGGLNLRRLSAGDRVAGSQAFPRNSKLFFLRLPSSSFGWATRKNRREIQGGGGW